jgi:hypothetical protein
MKAAKTTSQIKCFIHLFGGHGSKNTQVFFFRHTLSVWAAFWAFPLLAYFYFSCRPRFKISPVAPAPVYAH